MKDKDVATLCLIAQYLAENGYAISVREVGEAFGLTSPATPHQRLAKLREAGLVDWVDGERRTVHLTNAGKSALTCERVFGIMTGVE